MSETKAEARKKFVEKALAKFRREMEAQGVGVDAKINGETEAERLRIEMEKGGETEEWARREMLKQDIQAIRKEHEEANRPVDMVGHGGSGQIPLSGASGRKDMEFNSREQMIDTLRRMEHSDNPEAKEYAKQVLNEMFRKTAEAIKNKELTSPINFQEKQDTLSIIGRYKRKFRDKMKEKTGID